DPALPFAVTEKATLRDARGGALVAVGAGDQGARDPLEFAVTRTESIPVTVEVELTPRAFYRGHVFVTGRAVALAFLLAKDPVAVTRRQSYEGPKFKDFTDQFKEHPGRGYLHYGTNLQYKLVLTAEDPVRAVVRYGLKEKPESFKVATV